MYRILIILTAFLIFQSCSSQKLNRSLSGQSIDLTTQLNTIAFGSCNKTHKPQVMWNNIAQHHPDLFIWLGDNVYADTDDMAFMKAKYDAQKKDTSYQKFIHQHPVVGIWDDHDYGLNDGGKRYIKKKEAKALMLDFLDVPKDATVRSREGAYQSYLWGKVDKKIKLILLDTRYFRDDLEKNLLGSSRYKINPTGDILGDAQWAWLENELAKNEATIHIIASSIQVIATEHGFEKWANFPTARQRLFDLIQQHKPNHTIMMSGDRHISEVAKIDLPNLDYPLYEITSSSLTHAYVKNTGEPNQYRVGKLVNQNNFALLKINWKKSAELMVEFRGSENQLYERLTLN